MKNIIVAIIALCAFLPMSTETKPEVAIYSSDTESDFQQKFIFFDYAGETQVIPLISSATIEEAIFSFCSGTYLGNIDGETPDLVFISEEAGDLVSNDIQERLAEIVEFIIGINPKLAAPEDFKENYMYTLGLSVIDGVCMPTDIDAPAYALVDDIDLSHYSGAVKVNAVMVNDLNDPSVNEDYNIVVERFDPKTDQWVVEDERHGYSIKGNYPLASFGLDASASPQDIVEMINHRNSFSVTVSALADTENYYRIIVLDLDVEYSEGFEPVRTFFSIDNGVYIPVEDEPTREDYDNEESGSDTSTNNGKGNSVSGNDDKDDESGNTNGGTSNDPPDDPVIIDDECAEGEDCD